MATIPIYSPVDNSWFDHINIDHTNWDGRCPLQDDIEEINNQYVTDPASDYISWLLSQILDRRGLAATREIVTNRRRLTLMKEFVENTSSSQIKYFTGGSFGDGFAMRGGDVDTMCIDTSVIVTYPDQYRPLTEGDIHKTVLFMREADCQSGYVALELGSPVQRCPPLLNGAVVPVGDSMFISSDMFKQVYVDSCETLGLDYIINGPCGTITAEGYPCDIAFSFPCNCWPKEAEEWLYRTRLYGWPTQDLRDKIVQSGCHLVPVGDKCSSDTFLQWRISVLTAERRLVHSLSHQQFRVYGLLKYFLKQIKPLVENVIGHNDILCSYFMKTLLFHAVENSPISLWQEKHTYVCFRFCLRILMEWIKNGNCPNYFIIDNNMFKRKVHGENQQKLLHILTDVYSIKWLSLTVGTFYQPSIGELLYKAVHGHMSDLLPSRGTRERDRDVDMFVQTSELHDMDFCINRLMSPLRLLSESQSDTDEFMAYKLTVNTLWNDAMATFRDQPTPCANKQKYRDLRKCKRLLALRAAMYSSGLLNLATFHFLTGNYRQLLEMCGAVTSYPGYYICYGSEDRGRDRYERLYCGRGYSLYRKLKEVCAERVIFYKQYASSCLPHLHRELDKCPLHLCIPPLPYAVFLSFLCYHDLGDTKRRDAALLHLRAVNYDPEHGGHTHWIVHTLLGICYQTVGDNRRAIRSYTDSVHVQQKWNPAMERISVLYLVICYQALSTEDRR